MANTTDSHLPTIVYVEDNAGDAVLLEEALREQGHACQLLVIETGDKALHYFNIKKSEDNLPPPHCILLDDYLPHVTGAQLLRFIRSSKVYDDTPVYILAAETGYEDLLLANIVSKESFITKPGSWEGFIQLADMLMSCAKAKQDDKPASSLDSKPEVHAEGAMRRQEATEQRARPSDRKKSIPAT
jgi:DNA-binding response OmpR family regulator